MRRFGMGVCALVFAFVFGFALPGAQNALAAPLKVVTSFSILGDMVKNATLSILMKMVCQ